MERIKSGTRVIVNGRVGTVRGSKERLDIPNSITYLVVFGRGDEGRFPPSQISIVKKTRKVI